MLLSLQACPLHRHPLELYSQNSGPINFDGLVETEEWGGYPSFDISYEIEPGNNIAPPNKTKAYVSYSKTHMYVGFNAEVPRDQLRSAIRNRDQIWQDDRVAVCIDTFGDGRYMICLGSNANNIQFDLKLLAYYLNIVYNSPLIIIYKDFLFIIIYYQYCLISSFYI